MVKSILTANSHSRWHGIASLYGKGLAMGLGDSVPGVSGGTIAVITRIYEELISSIRKFDITFMRLICQFKLQDATVTMDYPIVALWRIFRDFRSNTMLLKRIL